MYAAKFQLQGFQASSAGTRAVIGRPIHVEAATVLATLGGEGSHFAARQLTEKVVRPVDLVLTMTRAQRNSVLELAPNRLRSTFTLCEASRLVTECGATTLAELPLLRSHLSADSSLDIDDPIGRDSAVFRRVGEEIAHRLQPIMELCRRSTDSPSA